MADMSIKIESGERTVDLVNELRGVSVPVIVAVYDVFFLGRIMEAAEKLDALHSELKSEAPADAEKFMDFYRKSQLTDKQMREIIDGLFDAPVCDTLYAHQSMFALGNGVPTWANVLYGVIDSMDAGLTSEKANAQQRIRKYSEKYKKR